MEVICSATVLQVLHEEEHVFIGLYASGTIC